MLARALDVDEAFGGDSELRRWLEQRQIGYVVAVPSSQTIPAVVGTSRADVLVAHAPENAWKRRSCGDGAKGPRLFDWAVVELPAYPDTTPLGWQRWLLARRSPTRNSKGEHALAYHLGCAPAGTTDEDLIRVAGTRWAIEDCFQTVKTEVGLDHYQVRPRRLVPAHHPGHARPHLPGSGACERVAPCTNLIARPTTPQPACR
jgi:SRSO17 transposase